MIVKSQCDDLQGRRLCKGSKASQVSTVLHDHMDVNMDNETDPSSSTSDVCRLTLYTCTADMTLGDARLERWRLNLAAMTADWLFVACANRIAAYPLACDGTPDRAGVLRLEPSMDTINQIATGCTGTLAVLVSVDDSGCVMVFQANHLDAPPVRLANVDPLGAPTSTWGLALSPTLPYFAVSANSHMISLFSVLGEEARAEPLALLHVHTHNIPCLDFSACGRWLASASIDESVAVWRMSSPPAGELFCHSSLLDGLIDGAMWCWGVRWLRCDRLLVTTGIVALVLDFIECAGEGVLVPLEVLVPSFRNVVLPNLVRLSLLAVVPELDLVLMANQGMAVLSVMHMTGRMGALRLTERWALPDPNVAQREPLVGLAAHVRDADLPSLTRCVVHLIFQSGRLLSFELRLDESNSSLSLAFVDI